jgi:hypothetical protein
MNLVGFSQSACGVLRAANTYMDRMVHHQGGQTILGLVTRVAGHVIPALTYTHKFFG